MTHAIIFDCFDVLVTNGLPPLVTQYLSNAPESEAVAWELEAALNAGRINYETFLLKLSELMHIPAAKVRADLESNEPNEPLFDYIKSDLRPNFKLGLLSNAGDNWLDELIGPRRVKLFDVVVLSYQVGITKPDPAIYQLTAERFGLKPGECVMIDDRPSYCDGARQAGMPAIQYKSVEQLKTDLRRLTNPEN